VPLELVDAALSELVPRLDAFAETRLQAGVPRGASDMLDAHWAFRDAEVGASWRCDPPISALPATAALLRASMTALQPPQPPSPPQHDDGGRSASSTNSIQDRNNRLSNPHGDQLRTDSLNVIVRRYAPGQVLKWHKDSIGLFEEPVYGAVLRSAVPDRAGCLEFKHRQDNYVVSEKPGLVHVQTGSSRFRWAHGVPGGTSQGRITVTWRWFRQSHVQWSATGTSTDIPGFREPLSQAARRRWICNFLGAASSANLRPELAEAFLLSMDAPRDDSRVPWLFNSKNEACGPQLSWARLKPFKRAAKSWRGRTVAKVVLERCADAAAAAGRADEEAYKRPRRAFGLDDRILPLLQLWEASQPQPDDGPAEVGEDEEENDVGEEEEEEEEVDEETLEERRAMQALGLPVRFSEARPAKLARTV